jgi:hypothetical protein
MPNTHAGEPKDTKHDTREVKRMERNDAKNRVGGGKRCQRLNVVVHQAIE